MGGEVVGPGVSNPSSNGTNGLITSVNGQTQIIPAGNGGILLQSNGGAIQISANSAGSAIEITTPDGGTITIDAGNADNNAALLLIVDGNGGFQVYDNGTGTDILVLPNLPTADPHTLGQLYVLAGVLHVSAG